VLIPLISDETLELWKIWIKKMQNAQILLSSMTALNDETLKWLLATVQEVNIRLQIKQMLMRYALYLDDVMLI